MSEKLYHAQILSLAKSGAGAVADDFPETEGDGEGRGEFRAKLSNPMCGDETEVWVRLEIADADEGGEGEVNVEVEARVGAGARVGVGVGARVGAGGRVGVRARVGAGGWVVWVGVESFCRFRIGRGVVFCLARRRRRCRGWFAG